jgi:hypothetical protein
MSSMETVVAVAVIIAYSIGRQLAGEPLRVNRLIGLPVALTAIGIVDVVANKGPGATRTDIVLIGAGCAINAAIGMCQGGLMRVESRNGYLWGQMPQSVLCWWAANIATGVIFDGIAHALGAHLATISAVILLRLGVNRLAQASVVVPRALATGIPFAPEPDKAGTPQDFRAHPERDRQLPDVVGPAPVTDEPRADSSPNPSIPGPPNNGSTDSPVGGAKRSGMINGSSRYPNGPPTSFSRQISQMLLREINVRINDPLK